MNEKTELYTIVWQQVYADWKHPVEEIIEQELEYSDFTEAKAELDRIMKL